MDSGDFAVRVRKAADLIGGQLELSRRSGISSKSINSYALGTAEPSRPRLIAMAKAANVSAGWLATGEGPMQPGGQGGAEVQPALEIKSLAEQQPGLVSVSGRIAIPQWQNPDPEMFDYIPMAEAQLSAGGGSFVISENMEGYYAFRKSWLSRVASSVKSLVLMRVQGDSMNPTIQDSDTVMIDTGRVDIKEGMLYALRFESTIMVKRLAFRPGGRIQIISDNRLEYESYEADLKDLYIIGQIIFFCRTFVPE